MPIIGGIKMACEPCIRGHRSTKCTHANERLMIPVKKPGRPLTQCPHLERGKCGCSSSITAAIPRNSKCGCSHKGGSTSDATVSSTSETSLSMGNNFRIQKPSHRQRKSFQISDTSQLENLVENTHADGRRESPPIAPNGSRSQNASFGRDSDNCSLPNGGYRHLSTSDILPNLNNMPSGLHPATANMAQDTALTMDVLRATMQQNGSNVPHSSRVGPLAAAVTSGSQNGGSCCSSSTSTPFPPTPVPFMEGQNMVHVTNNLVGISGFTLTDGNTMANMSIQTNGLAPQLSGSMPSAAVSEGNMMSHIHPGMDQEPTLYTIPNTYGSPMHPISPTNWKINQMLGPHQLAQAPIYNPNIVGMQSENANTVGYGAGDSTLHDCRCGDGCQCIGCAAHPYNDATVQTIMSAYKGNTDGEDDVQFTASPSAMSSIFGQQHLSVDFRRGSSDSSKLPSVSRQGSDSMEGAFAPPSLSHEPSSAGSMMEDMTGLDQTYNPDDFIFLQYELDSLACVGHLATCPCPAECPCFGCTIHNGSATLGMPNSASPVTGGSQSGATPEAPVSAKSCCSGGQKAQPRPTTAQPKGDAIDRAIRDFKIANPRLSPAALQSAPEEEQVEKFANPLLAAQPTPSCQPTGNFRQSPTEQLFSHPPFASGQTMSMLQKQQQVMAQQLIAHQQQQQLLAQQQQQSQSQSPVYFQHTPGQSPLTEVERAFMNQNISMQPMPPPAIPLTQTWQMQSLPPTANNPVQLTPGFPLVAGTGLPVESKGAGPAIKQQYSPSIKLGSEEFDGGDVVTVKKESCCA